MLYYLMPQNKVVAETANKEIKSFVLLNCCDIVTTPYFFKSEEGVDKMKVVLKEDVEKLGKPGDIIEVAPGYARNYLIPQKKALEATKSNLKIFEEFKRSQQKQKEKEKQQIMELAKKIERISCTIVMQAQDEQLYGAVTNADIAKALNQEGITIDKRDILLEEPIKALGVYQVEIKLHPEVKTEVKVWVVKK